MSGLLNKGVSSFFWDWSGKIGTQIATLFVGIILARLLEPSDFGLIAMVMIFVGIAQVFTDVGLSSALIQREKVLEVHYTSVFYFNIFIASLLSFFTFLIADSIGDYYQNTQLALLIKAICPLFVIKAISTVQSTIFKKDINLKPIAKINFFSATISGVIGCFLAYQGWGIWSLVWQLLLQAIIFSLFIWCASAWKPSLIFSFAALKQLWGFGFRVFIAGLIEAIFIRVDYLIIGKLTSLDTLGFFQKAKQLNKLTVKYSSGSVMSVLFPALSTLQNNTAQFNAVVFKGLNILCLIMVFLIGTLYLISDELIVFLYSDKWSSTSYYLKILLLSAFSYPISSLLVSVLKSKGLSKKNLYLQIIKKTFHMINFVNALFFGIDAYLYGLIIVALASVAVNVYFVNEELQVSLSLYYRPFFTQVLISFLSVLISIQINLIFSFNAFFDISIKVVTFSILFLTINFLFKTRSFNEIKSFIISITSRL